MKEVPTKSGNPYHEEENGQFTSKDGSGSNSKYKESNIPENISNYLSKMQQKHNINLNDIEKKHGAYNPHDGVFADGTSPSNAIESFLFNTKYWEMLSESDKQKEHNFFKSQKAMKICF